MKYWEQKKFNKLNEKLHGKSCQQNVLRERQTNREDKGREIKIFR